MMVIFLNYMYSEKLMEAIGALIKKGIAINF